MADKARGHRKTRIGYVESDKMDKTIVVSVIRRYMHPKYKKYVKERLRYKAHGTEISTTPAPFHTNVEG